MNPSFYRYKQYKPRFYAIFTAALSPKSRIPSPPHDRSLRWRCNRSSSPINGLSRSPSLSLSLSVSCHANGHKPRFFLLCRGFQLRLHHCPLSPIATTGTTSVDHFRSLRSSSQNAQIQSQGRRRPGKAKRKLPFPANQTVDHTPPSRPCSSYPEKNPDPAYSSSGSNEVGLNFSISFPAPICSYC